MIKNNNGFTLVELLATIALLGMVASIAVVSYTNIIGSGRDKVYENYIDTIHDEMVMHFIDTPSDMPNNNTKKTFYLNNLDISEINNPDKPTDKCKSSTQSKDSYIEVERNDTSDNIALKYKVCLKCLSYSKCKEY